MNLELTNEQLQLVMHALGAMPWHQANPVIVAIVQQQQTQAQQQSADVALGSGMLSGGVMQA